MNKLITRLVLSACILGFCSPPGFPQSPEDNSVANTAVIHTVMFSLKNSPDSQAAARFLNDGKRILSAIPGVLNFEVYRQVSAKNNYQFGFSMHFVDRAAFENYLNHPQHTEFVKNRWNKEVSAFLEADYTAYPPD